MEDDGQDSMFGPIEGCQVPQSEAAEEADDMTCAICLERTPLTDIALVKGCEHQYCVNCILQWALCKEWCPQCKHPFDYLLTHKQLDGSITDFLTEESVVLLKRAQWFVEYMRTSEKGKATLALIQSRSSSSGLASAAAAAASEDGDARDWADLYEDYLDAELEEDEEIESYYFSSAAGRARVVLGNRRWGEGGYMRAGRMYARPVVNGARTPNAAGGKAGPAQKGPAKGGKASTNAAAAAGGSSSSQSAGGAGSSNGATSSGAGSSSAAAAGASSSGNRGRQGSGRSAATGVAPWLDEESDFDEDDEDFTIYESGSYNRGGGGGANGRQADRSCSSSRSRGRMIKPQRCVPKGAAVTPAVASAACPVVNTPLGKSPGSVGFHVGSWGITGKSPNSCGGMWAAAAAGVGTPGTAGSSPPGVGSAPGSGRRARRNARRAAADVGDDID